MKISRTHLMTGAGVLLYALNAFHAVPDPLWQKLTAIATLFGISFAREATLRASADK